MTKTLCVFDPAMCCSTGVCGTDVDPKLIAFASDLAWLASEGVTVRRYNLAQQPSAFAENAAVKEALQNGGTAVLPILVVNGEIATRSIYPTRDQLAAILGLSDASGCCEAERSCCADEEGPTSCCDTTESTSGCCSGESSKSSCC